MKTEREIWEKIEEIETKIEEEKKTWCCDLYKKQRRIEDHKCAIDALLWVVGDESGKPI